MQSLPLLFHGVACLTKRSIGTLAIEDLEHILRFLAYLLLLVSQALQLLGTLFRVRIFCRLAYLLLKQHLLLDEFIEPFCLLLGALGQPVEILIAAMVEFLHQLIELQLRLLLTFLRLIEVIEANLFGGFLHAPRRSPLARLIARPSRRPRPASGLSALSAFFFI